jgi:hypothetical protein
MKHTVTITVLLTRDDTGERDGCAELIAMIDDRDYDLGRFDNTADLAHRMRTWIYGRGLTTPPGSAAALQQAVDEDRDMFTVEVITEDEYDRRLAAIYA